MDLDGCLLLDLTTLKKTLICCAFGDVDSFRNINGLQNEAKIVINPPIPAEIKVG